MKTLRVGIVGCGVIGPTHAESFTRLEGVELAWACDLDRGRAEALAEKYGAANVTTDYAEIMADDTVDCVSVCTDHASHVPIVIAALENGKHVLCEKALVANRKGLDAMFAVHAAHPELLFGAVSQHRFEAVNRRLREYVAQGVFGTLLSASIQVRCFRSNAYYEADAWRGTWAAEGGSVLINQAIHFVDILVWVMGGVAGVCGCHANRTHHGVIETEDTAAAVLRFRNGALGAIEATSSSNMDWDNTMVIAGSEGTIEMSNNRPRRVCFADEALQQQIEDELRACCDAPGVSAGKSYYGSGHVGQIADFVAAIRENRQPFVPAVDVQHTVDVVLGIYNSQATGAWVEL